MTRRTLYFIVPPLLCLAVFWRAPLTWFVDDDFAWLGLPLQVHGTRDLLVALFKPQAQGTVRVLSERAFFLAFSGLFGLHALPYRIWVLLTWFADLTLVSLVGARLTGSRAAGFLAAILWTTSVNVTVPLVWTSAYNEVLCAFCILLAFYARLRGWRIAEWAAYLAGFGALELIVVYPVIATLHAFCLARKQVWSAVTLFIPAAIFTILRFLLVPQNAGDYYQLIVDRRLPRTFFHYLEWALGPARPEELFGSWRGPGRILTLLLAAALLAFVFSRIRRREFAAIFCCGWFLILIAPVLPLPNHVTDYYVLMPEIGFAWLGGWAIVSAWQHGVLGRGTAIVLTASYLAVSIAEIDLYTDWYLDRADRMQAVMQGVAKHAGSTVLLQGIDDELFQSGFQGNPFRLVGVEKVYLAPGAERGINARADQGGIAPWVIAPRRALSLIQHGDARVLSLSGTSIRDVTRIYESILRADPLATRVSLVNVADPDDASQLGPTWYPAEQQIRWMPKVATVKLSGPKAPSQELIAIGFAPAALLAAGPLGVSFRVDGTDIGSVSVTQPGESFSFELPLPPKALGRETIEITIEVSRVLHAPPDPRDLGLAFASFAIK